MKKIIIEKPDLIEKKPLKLVESEKPEPGKEEVLIKVSVCGICRTDLHIIEGEIHPSKMPIVLGHQIVGVIEEVGEGVNVTKIGERVGVPWLSSTCGSCYYCKNGMENLCDNIRFTGFDVNGGLEEYMTAPSNFVYEIPGIFSDEQAAPLLCGGMIGYRALKISEISGNETLGLFGFGASAHISLQIAKYWGAEVQVFTRTQRHRKLARELGADWVGSAQDSSPGKLDRAIIFAPAGYLIPIALEKIRKGGTLALAGIYMDKIPEMPYNLIYGERKLVSVANSTKKDAVDLLRVAAEIPIIPETETFKLEEANEAYLCLKNSEIKGACVLKI